MKSSRHDAILKLIEHEIIDTQDALTARLREQGFEVTQATVSRDIRQLGLVKTRSVEGQSRYSIPNPAGKNFAGRLANILKESINHVDSAENIVVIKTFSGMAQAACAALDMMSFDAIVGTLAGEDTIMVVCKDVESAESCRDDFLEYIG